MKTFVVNVRLGEDEKHRLDSEAKSRGITLSELMRERIVFAPRLHPEVERYVKELSAGTEIPPYLIIENTLIGIIAARDAENQVWGESPRTLEEFVVTDKGIVQGEELYMMLLQARVQEEEQRREISTLRDEAAGVPLNEESREFLIRRRKGQAWFESAEFRKAEANYREISELAKEARESGMVPAGLKISEFSLANLWRAVKDGRWTPEQFTEQITLSANTRHGWGGK